MKSIEYYGIEILSQSEQKKLGVQLPLGKTGDSKSTYEIITNLVIELIDKSDLPAWQKPWAVNQLGERNIPMNFDTKRAYSGVNNFLLTMLMDIRKHQCPYFLTFKQLEALKGKIRKGAKSYPICFYTSDLYRNQQGKTIQKSVWEKLPESQQKEYEPSFTLKYYNAFNAEDIEGIEFGTDWLPRELPQKEQIESCENIVWSMKNRPEIYNNGGDTAAYYPLLDIIRMPLFNYFQKEQFYYSTLFHELVHATGSPSRLEREEKKKRKSWGDSFYAYEELIAEMGACYLCGEAGILYYNLKNSAAYIKSWKAGVKNYLAEDPKFFFRACADAQRAADYILGKSDPLIYAKFKRIDAPKVDSDTIVVKPKANHLKESKVSKLTESDKVEKLKIQLNTLKEKVIQNSKFKEKIAAELKAFLNSQGLSGTESQLDKLKRQIKFYKNLLSGDTADFKAIAKRVGYSYSISKPRKKGSSQTTISDENTLGKLPSDIYTDRELSMIELWRSFRQDGVTILRNRQSKTYDNSLPFGKSVKELLPYVQKVIKNRTKSVTYFEDIRFGEPVGVYKIVFNNNAQMTLNPYYLSQIAYLIQGSSAIKPTKETESTPINSDKIVVNTVPIIPKNSKESDKKIEKLKMQLTTLKNKVIENSKFKEKIAAELKAYLSSQGLSGTESQSDKLKRQIKFYKNLLSGDTADFKAIAKRVGYSYSVSKPRKKREKSK